MQNESDLHPSTTTTIEQATTMESRKVLWYILGICLLSVTERVIVNGAALDTTTEELASESVVVPEEIIEAEPYTTMTPNSCVCNCENQKNIADCATEPQEIDLTTTEKALEIESGNNAMEPSDTPNAESGIAAGATDNGAVIWPDPTDSSANIPTADASNVSGDLSTSAPTPECSTAGLQPHETNCHAFYDCSSAQSSDGSLRLISKFCAPNQAFNVELGACGRDISSCQNDVVCLAKGGVADPLSNTSYYLCEPRLVGGGFHVFHVQCSENQIFFPALGKCFLDYTNLNQQPYPAFPPFNWNQIEDIDVVKAELKVIKEYEKLQLKVEKERVKAEKKLQKEAEKEAERVAKEQEKLLKDQIKLESEAFICQQVGNFPSNISETVYYACTAKKTKYKKTLMKCPLGSKFDIAGGVCVTDTNSRNAIETDDEEDDD